MASIRQTVECPECGLRQTKREPKPHRDVLCERCDKRLARTRRNGLERSFALTVCALVLLVMAFAAPLMDLEYQGRTQRAHLVTGIVQLWRIGFEPLAVLIAFTSVIAPLVGLVGLLAVVLPLALNKPMAYIAPLYRRVMILRPWSMLEVYLLGMIVAYVKMSQLASVDLGLGAMALGALIPVLIGGYDSLDARVIWQSWDASQAADPPESPSPGPTVLTCPTCGYAVAAESGEGDARYHCPRCHDRFARRLPFSLQRTWALVITAALLYVPANVWPMMHIDKMGHAEDDTILAGVGELINDGMWQIAALIFFASIVVPMLKIVGLVYLMLAIQLEWPSRRRSLHRLYRIVEGIGRWSMIDMFVTSLLVALVQMGQIATIVPGPAATCFAGVVVLTMFAAMSFDPRLIWDRAEAAAPVTPRAEVAKA